MDDGKGQTPIEWDAPAKDAGGAEYTAWEAVLEQEPYEVEARPQL